MPYLTLAWVSVRLEVAALPFRRPIFQVRGGVDAPSQSCPPHSPPGLRPFLSLAGALVTLPAPGALAWSLAFKFPL